MCYPWGSVEIYARCQQARQNQESKFWITPRVLKCIIRRAKIGNKGELKKNTMSLSGAYAALGSAENIKNRDRDVSIFII